MNVEIEQPGVTVDPSRRSHATALRPVVVLVCCYLGLSVLTLVAAALLRSDPGLVNDAVWVRGTIVAAASVLMLLFAISAARGSRRGYLRVRIVSAITLIAIMVVAALPGLLPLWMRLEQVACGLLLAAAVVILNLRGTRAQFAKRS